MPLESINQLINYDSNSWITYELYTFVGVFYHFIASREIIIMDIFIRSQYINMTWEIIHGEINLLMSFDADVVISFQLNNYIRMDNRAFLGWAVMWCEEVLLVNVLQVVAKDVLMINYG